MTKLSKITVIYIILLILAQGCANKNSSDNNNITKCTYNGGAFVLNVADIEVINNDLMYDNETNIPNIYPRKSLIEWFSNNFRAAGVNNKLTIIIEEAKLKERMHMSKNKNYLCIYDIVFAFQDDISDILTKVNIRVHNTSIIPYNSNVDINNILNNQICNLLIMMRNEIDTKIQSELNKYSK